MKSVLLSASALLLCVAATPMKAAEIVQEPSVGIRLGVLTCRLEGGPGFVVVSSKAAHAVIDILTKHTLDVWVYGAKDWYVRSRHAPHVDREEWTVKFPPTVVSSYDGLLDRVVKIVGVSDDHDVMALLVEALITRKRVRRPIGIVSRSVYGQPLPLMVSADSNAEAPG